MWEIPALAILNELRSRGVLQGYGQVRTAGALCPRHDAGVGEDQAPEDAARSLHLRFRHPAAARLPVAGLVRAGDDRRARLLVPRHLQLPHRAAPRGRGGRHQRARTADGLCGARATPTRSIAAAPYRVLEDWQEDYQGNLLRHPARHLRHVEFLAERARLGAELDRHPHRFEGPDRGRRGGDRLVALARPESRRRSSRSSPTGSTSTSSSGSIGISAAACASATAGARF